MLWKLFLAFTIIPVSEIYILIAIGGQIGILPSIGLVILTGIVGASLARSQGLQTLGRIRDSFQQGVVPGEELLNALLIAIAGIVLLTPGFLTDAAGLFLLIPATRTLCRGWLKRRIELVYAQRNVGNGPIIYG
ncbi:MAG: FxsA family protein [SAR324 cluster bacterium]|nr:FxsA family protein [SAR324 cluster bacterium]MEC8595255.1 FxsA family protein [SAR324 cluster bacterium]|tara:strand:- start:44 stop:445 length:402 start_codon:yes stop_codon:yes gene_type:complete